MNRAEKFWDKRSIKFEESLKKNEKTYVKTIELTKKHLNSSDSVLDVGCATGATAYNISAKVQKVLAIDISSKMIDIAKQKFDSEKHKNVTFEHSSIFDVRSKKEEFNAILSFNILHLLEDAPKVMQRINELLKQGGLFISVTPCMGEKTTFSSVFYLLLSKTGLVPHLKFAKFIVLEDLVTNSGFRIVETKNMNGTPLNYFIVAMKI